MRRPRPALVGFTRSLAREVGELGITVNAVAPGFVETEMTREMDRGAARAHHPAQRAAPAGGSRGRRRGGRIPVSDKAQNITGSDADGRRRQHRLASAIRAPSRLPSARAPAALRVERRIERHVLRRAPRSSQYSSSPIARRVVALEQQLLLLQLEGRGHFEPGHDAQKQRARIVGQALRDLRGGSCADRMPAKPRSRPCRRGRRLRAPHAVHHGVVHARAAGQSRPPLRWWRRSRPSSGTCRRCGRRSRRTLCVRRIRSPVRYQASPGGEHIAQDLLARSPPHRHSPRSARLRLVAASSAAPIASPVSSAAQRTQCPCGVAQRGRRCPASNLTNATGMRCERNGGMRPIAPARALAVVEREVALGRGVVLQDLRDAEALLKRLPDLARAARCRSTAAGDARSPAGRAACCSR